MPFKSLFRRRFYFGNADFTSVIGLSKKNESIIDGSEVCLLNRYFDADFTSVIGLSKTNALVTIFAKYLMGKTDNFQYSTIVDLAQSRGYTIDGVNYNLYGYYIDYVTRRIAM